MGVISRKIFPACANMCVCCPALRSRSRRPVKRYKNLLAEIFPKSPDGPPNERKIGKLCEYAAKNPFRIPKIAKYLEEKCYKELRYNHIKLVIMIMEVYNKLLFTCKEQMACFAANVLNVCIALLDDSKQDTVQITGCQTLTRFIYSQMDGTYTYDLEILVQKICMLAHKTEEGDVKTRLRAASLQCLSAMVWFMTKFSHIFVNFDEIVNVTLGNYEPNTLNEAHHNWVDEVVRHEGKVVGSGNSCSYMIVRPHKQKRDPSLLTREETQTPKVWAQICIQIMVELARESTTIRRLLDPIFVYFDTNRQWVPPHGFGFMVLSDMAYFVETPGTRQLIIASLVHHLDHKNVTHDPQVKSHIIQAITALARQVRTEVALTDIGYISDLCRHLKKTLQANIQSVEEQELNLNTSLQSLIEDCLLEIAQGVINARPLFDIMVTTLEKLPSGGAVAQATTGSMIILAHMIVVASISSNSQQVFPEDLLLQLLKLMVHPDVEIRSRGHHIYLILLIQNSNYLRYDASIHTRRWSSDSASMFSSVTSLLNKLRKENNGTKAEKHEVHTHDRLLKKGKAEAEMKQAWGPKLSANFPKLNCVVDKTAVEVAFSNAEPSVTKFREDQITQLMSTFWMQANLPDNTLSNIEALAYSFCLTLVNFQTPIDNLVVHIFQFPLSLWKLSLDYSNGMLCPANRRSLVTLSFAMLMFAAKMYQVPDIADLLEPILKSDVDTYLGINDDFHVYVKPEADVKEYCSAHDNEVAASLLIELRIKMHKYYETIVDILVQKLSSITELEKDEVGVQLLETFVPDDAIFGPQSMLHLDHAHKAAYSKGFVSFDVAFLQTNSLVEDDAISESSLSDLSRFVSKTPTPNNTSHVISIRQLLESVLEVAGEVAGTSISTSPLPFGAMANQCDAIGVDSRKTMSTWLSPGYTKGEDEAVSGGLSLRLPPATPFDSFLRAATCSNLC